ncbi:MAG: hypothetical protein AAF063_16825, partial [Cyanobacteria bacterium J06643_5]
MQDKSQKNSQKIKKIKEKGLGWVPDYPDLRDYNLDDEDIKNSQRLKVEETFASIENLFDEIVRLQSNENPRNQIDELRSRFFGGVAFKKVRVYKILRRDE